MFRLEIRFAHLTTRWEPFKVQVLVSEFSSLLSAGTVGTPIWASLGQSAEAKAASIILPCCCRRNVWTCCTGKRDRIGSVSKVMSFCTCGPVFWVSFSSLLLCHPYSVGKRCLFGCWAWWRDVGLVGWNVAIFGNLLEYAENDVIGLRPTVCAFIALVCIEWHYSSVLFRWKGTWRLDTPVYPFVVFYLYCPNMSTVSW